mmetsp:Transcript_3183/g.5733  ORF Transcript_3183/g.5733 Transcript_3183/m.5733 type:complete len:216 (+) Transcript_3183:608-1255(+)
MLQIPFCEQSFPFLLFICMLVNIHIMRIIIVIVDIELKCRIWRHRHTLVLTIHQREAIFFRHRLNGESTSAFRNVLPKRFIQLCLWCLCIVGVPNQQIDPEILGELVGVPCAVALRFLEAYHSFRLQIASVKRKTTHGYFTAAIVAQMTNAYQHITFNLLVDIKFNVTITFIIKLDPTVFATRAENEFGVFKNLNIRTYAIANDGFSHLRMRMYM